METKYVAARQSESRSDSPVMISETMVHLKGKLPKDAIAMFHPHSWELFSDFSFGGGRPRAHWERCGSGISVALLTDKMEYYTTPGTVTTCLGNMSFEEMKGIHRCQNAEGTKGMLISGKNGNVVVFKGISGVEFETVAN